ncbi:hypothetical protein [Agromyces flavus]|uniref:hypothetical protein n=1 Tax=Agromyces flavus TaxID=589382 RepID=UPI001062B5E2|nr:hypothetical protein [Agromyces flavus]GGI45582.1 hypothetical protein GCM10010932_10270 [Agromyces flavus]
MLAAIAGVIIVGVGGGLIRPMQQRWERYLSKAEEEAPRIKAEAQGYPAAQPGVHHHPGRRPAHRDLHPARHRARPGLRTSVI